MGAKRTLAARVAGIGRDPAGAWERFCNRLDRKLEYSRPAPVYRPDSDWDRRLHEMMGCAWPCPETRDFHDVWASITAFVTARGIRFGPQSFYGWNDGDPEFARTLWCLVRHMIPSRIVEAGVAHGVSTRVMLEALERNGQGELWSIDPPPVEQHLAAEVAVAVNGFAPARWHLVRGTSRRRLPSLIAELGAIELFVHDSLHTRRNVCFEVGEAAKALNPGSFAIIDDIDTNWGFDALMRQRPADAFLVCQSEPVRPDPRRFDGKGLFGVMRLAG